MESQTEPLSIASGDLSLEAQLHQPLGINARGILVVCHPHPQYGGSMDNTVVLALCEAALQEGLAALRFNFRGVGQSDGGYEGGAGEQGDVRAALAAATGLPGGARLGLAGYSFGAAMAVRSGCGGDTARALILVSPPLATIGASDFSAGSASVMLLAGDADPICPAAALEALAARLQPPASYQIIAGADHSWLGYEAGLRDTAGLFLRWHVL